MDMDMDTTIVLRMKCNEETFPLRNHFLFSVIGNDFITFKTAVTSNFNREATVKMGHGLEVASHYISNGSKVTSLLKKSILPSTDHTYGMDN
jgi:hypothetical protein